MNHLLSEGKLLNEEGLLNEAGYATSLVKEYNRKDIKARPLRIKEWDYYYVGNSKYGIALTIDDNSYMSLMSVSFLDFENKKDYTKSPMGFMSKGKVGLPSTSKIGDTKFKNKNVDMNFLNDGTRRHIICSMKKFIGDKDFSCDFYLDESIDGSMVIATPFDKPKYFYYNQKINCLKASGSFKIGEEVYSLDDCFGVLDWGRGVWTYKNTWYWSSLNAEQDGKTIGFNLGYGFGNTSAASENMFFYDGKTYKLNDVKFNIPLNEKGKEKYLEPWTFTSESGDIDLVFTPILNRNSDSNVIIIQSLQNQVFGKFSGKIRIGNEVVEIKDLLGFAEKVKNCW